MKNTKGETVAAKSTIAKRLYSIFSDANHMCVKDIYFDKNDEIFEKYAKICEETVNNCDECWIKFLTEDLVLLEEPATEIHSHADMLTNVCGCEGSCPVCRIGEVENHRCNKCRTEYCQECHGIMNSTISGFKSLNGILICTCKPKEG